MRRTFVTFLSILLFLSVLVLGGAILSNNSSAQPSQNAAANRGATEMHWASVCTTQGDPYIKHASHPSIEVREVQWGIHIVTFPSNFKVLACTAAVNHSVGHIIPFMGYECALDDNESKITVFTSAWARWNYDFTVVAYSQRGPN